MSDREIAANLVSAVRELSSSVLWWSGNSGRGKTAISTVFEAVGIYVFRTDKWILNADRWCSDATVVEKVQNWGRGNIGTSINHFATVEDDKLDVFVEGFFHSEYGFRPAPKLSMIEGYMHWKMQKPIIDRLEQRGHRVWLATTPSDLEKFHQLETWRQP